MLFLLGRQKQKGQKSTFPINIAPLMDVYPALITPHVVSGTGGKRDA